VDQNTLQAVLREAMREAVAEFLQMLPHLDREAFLQERGGRRNGYYPRKLETTFGQVDVGEVAVALYAAGVSQRKAAEVMSLLLGHRYTQETISGLTDQVLEGTEAFRQSSPKRVIS